MADGDHTARAQGLLEELLTRMGVEARVAQRPQPASAEGINTPSPILDVTGDDLGLLIGWRGETLRAIQTVLNLMMGDDQRRDRRVIIDVERYRARREDQVRDLAVRMADRVKRTGQRHILDPMHGYERRVVHLILQGDPGVRTESVGREPGRRVVISPSEPAGAD
ncbi:MAG: protein jag [Candidatus Dormibacteria bacterium]